MGVKFTAELQDRKPPGCKLEETERNIMKADIRMFKWLHPKDTANEALILTISKIKNQVILSRPKS